MKLKNKTIRYYPLKQGKGFVMARTTQPKQGIGFATFKKFSSALSSGVRWYGTFKGRDPLSYVKKIKVKKMSMLKELEEIRNRIRTRMRVTKSKAEMNDLEMELFEIESKIDAKYLC